MILSWATKIRMLAEKLLRMLLKHIEALKTALKWKCLKILEMILSPGYLPEKLLEDIEQSENDTMNYQNKNSDKSYKVTSRDSNKWFYLGLLLK